jgi:hypothetical protein
MTLPSAVRGIILPAFLLTGVCSVVSAQTVDPVRIIAEQARTHVATGRPAHRKAQPSHRQAGRLLPAGELPSELVRRDAQPAPATPPPALIMAREQSVPSAASFGSLVLLTIAVIAALAATVVFLAVVSRLYRQSVARRSARPSVIAPIPFDMPVHPEPRPSRVPQDLDEPSAPIEFAERYQRGRGEMELALALERLKQELPALPVARHASVPKTRSGRIAAARKRGIGSGEMDLALRLQQLRNASHVEARS